MATDEKAKRSRKPRADAERNRLRLIGVARAMFAEAGAGASLEEIARRAEVGIGTLYRHFPTREALLADVYRHALEELAAAAPRLLAERGPTEALRAWMRLFVDYIATKRVVMPALATTGGTSALFAAAGSTIETSITHLVDAAVAAGEIRLDVPPMSLLKALYAVSLSDDAAAGREAALQLIDILIDGARAAAARPD